MAKRRVPTVDPMEETVRSALTFAEIGFVESQDPRALNLDFYLTTEDLHIEVKRFHAPRIAEQMSRAPNVIAIQGLDAAKFVARLIRNSKGRLQPNQSGTESLHQSKNADGLSG
ncbi:hypothetical protein [Mesorhizobium sp. M0058]|uniref:hypothetical protein n=1 Tax=Mesorhizobium sp. M0058 TaxID=2956865 RepID=UPI00333CE442